MDIKIKKYSSHNITILNFNANGVKKQKNLLQTFMTRYNVDIACITETHFAPGETFSISGYNCYRSDRNSRTAAGGVAILTRKNLKHHESAVQTTSIETVAISIELVNIKQLKIICGYRQPNKKLQEEDVRNMFTDNGPSILVGDLNCKNQYWGCRTNNPNGILLNTYSTNYQLTVMTPAEFTYYPHRNDYQPDILDIVVAKKLTVPLRQTVIHELDSDHLPVLISLSEEPIQQKYVPRLINGFVHWETFKTELANLQRDAPLTTSQCIDTEIRVLTQNITHAVKAATNPKKLQYKNVNIPPQYIIDLIKEKRRIRRQWQLFRDPQLKQRINNLTHTITRELERQRINQYQNFISSMETNDPGLWKTTRRILKKQENIPILIHNNIPAASDQEKVNLFADHLEKTFTPHIQFTIHHLCTAIQ